MTILLFTFGQTCNKFFLLSNYLAEAIEYNQKIIILAPDITINDYPHLLKSKYIKFPLYSKRLGKLLGHKNFINLLSRVFENSYSRFFFEFILKPSKSISVIDAFSTNQNLKSEFRLKYKKEICDHFEPRKSIRELVNRKFSQYSDTVIIGIHMRKGDYKNYMNGKYFYAQIEYREIINRVSKLFENIPHYFFISSNEKLEPDVFNEEIKFFNLSSSKATQDLLGLSLCNYIIGPPSTFSGWASFYGDVPIKFIENKDENISLKKFKNILRIWSSN